MKIIKRLIALPRMVAATASVNPIPIIAAENILIASPIPRLPGVMDTRIAMLPIDAINNALKKLSWISNIEYRIIKLIAPKTSWIKLIKAVAKIIFLLSLIKCQPFITLTNLLIHLFLDSGNFGEKIIIENRDINMIKKR